MAANTRLGVLIATAVTLSAVAGCTTPPPTQTPTPSVTVTATPTPTPLSPAEQDLENAKAAVVRLWATYDRIAIDPTAPINDIDVVSGLPLRDTLQQNLARYRQYELTGSGATVVEDATAKLAGVNDQGLTTWTVTACLDRADFDLVDASGKSVIGPPYRVVHQATVALRGDNFTVVQDESTGTC